MKQKVREAAREAILEAAEAAFAADGVQGASMQSIATRAGTSVGTLYNYFEDRDALVRALFEEHRTRLADAIDAMQGAGFHERLTEFVRAVMTHFDEHRALLAVVLSAGDVAAQKRRSAGTVLRERIDSIMELGVRTKVIRADRAHIAAMMLLGTLRAVLLDAVERAPSKPVRFVDLVDPIVAQVLHGAAA